jgi:hypothetical protein
MPLGSIYHRVARLCKMALKPAKVQLDHVRMACLTEIHLHGQGRGGCVYQNGCTAYPASRSDSAFSRISLKHPKPYFTSAQSDARWIALFLRLALLPYNETYSAIR